MQDAILMIMGIYLVATAFGIVLGGVLWLCHFILKGRRGDAYSLFKDRQNY